MNAVHADRVLRHVTDPAAAMTVAIRILRLAGRAVLTEPDWRTLVIDPRDPYLSDAFTRYVVEHQVQNSRIGIALHGCAAPLARRS